MRQIMEWRNKEIFILNLKAQPGSVCTYLVQHIFSAVFQQTEARDEVVVVYCFRISLSTFCDV